MKNNLKTAFRALFLYAVNFHLILINENSLCFFDLLYTIFTVFIFYYLSYYLFFHIKTTRNILLNVNIVKITAYNYYVKLYNC